MANIINIFDDIYCNMLNREIDIYTAIEIIASTGKDGRAWAKDLLNSSPSLREDMILRVKVIKMLDKLL